MIPTAETQSSLTQPQSRHEVLGLAVDDLLGMYRTMLLARRLDERMAIIQRQGRVAFHISCQGHEATQVGTAWALKPGVDFVHPYYRDLGVVLTIGLTPRQVMLAHLARRDDTFSRGRQMPAHYGDPDLHIITGSSPVATQIPQAVGIAYASRLRGEDAVTITYFGDGATSKGDFHEGLNFAGIHKLPVIFVCENNLYAISVHQTRQMAIENVADRAAGYGFPGVVVDGNDVLAVYEAMRKAVDRARCGEGPTLLEAKTYRFTPHSSDDDDRPYRSREEVEFWKTHKDPIRLFRTYLFDEGILTESLDEEIEVQVMESVDDATDYADAAPLPRPEDALGQVYATAVR